MEGPEVALKDGDVRLALKKKVLHEHMRDPDTLVVDELGLLEGQSRIDIAVVNGKLVGYEIKSERDTLDRLPRQQAIYSAIFDKITLVVAESHMAAAVALVPEWWGVKCAASDPEGDIVFSLHRTPKANPSVDPRALVQLLWSNEMADLLEKIGAARGVRGKPRAALQERLVQVMNPEELGAAVRSALKGRAGWRVDAP